jgi:Family of unknown function (DUF5681)
MHGSSETEDTSALKSEPSQDMAEVGYCQPPVGTRFRKGQSGNPKGRPKGKKNLKTLLELALNEKITVNENGRRKSITKAQAGMKQVANQVASGDAKIALKILEMHDRHEKLLREIDATNSGPIVSSLPESANARQRLIEITHRLQQRIEVRKKLARS